MLFNGYGIQKVCPSVLIQVQNGKCVQLYSTELIIREKIIYPITKKPLVRLLPILTKLPKSMYYILLQISLILVNVQLFEWQ